MAILDPIDPARWEPAPSALERAVWEDPADARPTSILLRHPSAPFESAAAFDDDEAVRRAAADYVAEAAQRAEMPVPRWWLRALHPDTQHPEFGWLDPVPDPEPDRPGQPRPIGSVRIAEILGNGRPVNRALVLLAGEHSGDLVFGSEFGIRVVVLPRLLRGGEAGIRIIGFSATLPFGPYRSDGGDNLRLDDQRRNEAFRLLLGGLRSEVAAALGLDAESVFFRSIRAGRAMGGAHTFELRGRGFRAGTPAEPFEFVAHAEAADGLEGATLLSVEKDLLSACMGLQPQTRVFTCDPASSGGAAQWRRRRPTRTQAELDLARVPAPVADPLMQAGEFAVVPTFYVLGDDPAAGPLSVPGANLPIRSDQFTAVNAFWNVRQLFDRFRLYGIPIAPYFAHAALPVRVRYRSGVRPGPGKDGQTVNGRVLPAGWNVNAVVGTVNPPPRLDLHLALGNLSTRVRAPWDGANRSPSRPLGFATDPRWIWHEAAHILLMAQMGELELRFAHSMGDGLAAIIGDPDSRFPDGSRWRGMTFPFVFAARRHDRCVLHGWGWSGSLGWALREQPDARRIARKGYRSEQILSTSLFRLYRCIGGDTVHSPGHAQAGQPDEAARRRASDYVVYLLMRALQLAAPPLVAPAARAEFFAEALAMADDAAVAVPVQGGAARTGGCARAVIGWAFEAQGADPAGAAGFAGVRDAVGPRPGVDVFVADRRPTGEDFPDAGLWIDYGAGCYAPVSLDWGGLGGGAPGGAEPAWFAVNNALRSAGGALTVRVGNRGQNAAAGVQVRVWSLPWPDNQAPPDWDAGAWNASPLSIPQNIGPGAAAEFAGLPLPAARGRHLVLAETVCAADRSCIDPLRLLAPSMMAVPLPELVPLDNNLGLAVIQVP